MSSLGWSYWISADRGALADLPHGRVMEKTYTARFYSASPFLIQSVACCWCPIYPSNQQFPLSQKIKRGNRKRWRRKRERREIKDKTTLSVFPGTRSFQGCPGRFGLPSGIL